MMRVPGRKESGVIFTMVTELPPKERLERSERDRPSVSGLQCSKDETEGPERERPSRGAREGCEGITRGGDSRAKKKKKETRELRHQQPLKKTGKI